MALVRSTTRPISDAMAGGAGNEGDGSKERIVSTRLSDVDSPSDGGDARAESSRSPGFYFRPSTMSIRQIHRMVDGDCFIDGMDHEPGEETVPEPWDDEAVVFEEFFTAGLRMPSHPVLATILLKYQIQVHQLMPNAVVQLSK
jgi:hypothetical protein